MASYDIRPLQLRVLELLKVFHRVCSARGLRYFITAGTLLGAVRHGGFIPWDDDLDVAMPRPDYDCLIAHAAGWLPPHAELVCAENDASYPLPFAKLQDAGTTLLERPHLPYLGGVYMDVFPLDGVPSSPLARRLHFARHEYLKRTLYFLHRDPYRHGHGPSSWVPLAARKIYTPAGVQAAMRHLMTAVPYESSPLAADHDDGMKGVMRRSIFGNPAPILFEGTEVWSYACPEEYLRRKYGDSFMTPPPAQGRRQHNFFYLDLDTPYRDSAQAVAAMVSGYNRS